MELAIGAPSRGMVTILGIANDIDIAPSLRGRLIRLQADDVTSVASIARLTEVVPVFDTVAAACT